MFGYYQPQRDPWSDFEEVGTAGPSAGPAPLIQRPRSAPMATPQTYAQEQGTIANTDQSYATAGRTRAETANLPSPEEAAAQRAAELRQAQAAAAKAEAEAQALAQRGGMTPEGQRLAQERSQQEAAINMVTRNYLTQRSQFSNQIEGGMPSFLGSIGMAPGRYNGDYSSFNVGGESLASDANRVFRVPGQGDPARQMEERQNRVNAPSTWNDDATNRRILDDIQVRIEEARRAAGLPPLDWEASITRGDLVPAQAAPEAQNSASGTNLSTAIYRPNPQQPGTPDNQASVRDIEDPVRRGHAMQIAAMMNDREVPEQEILAYHAQYFPGEDPVGLQQTLERRRDPNSNERRAMSQGRKPFSPDPGWFTTQREATGLEQTIGAALDSQPGTVATNYLNSAMGGWLPDAAGLAGLDSQTVRAGMEGQRAMNPMSALAGDIAGFAGAAGMAGRVARNANFMQNLPRSRALAGDVAYGASYGAGSNPNDRLGGAATGAALQGGAGMAGREGFRALGNTARGVSNPSVQRLREAGVPMTVGNTVGQSGIAGQMVRGLENAATSIPVVGRQITARQIEARAAYNRNTWNEALQSIGGSVGQRSGEQAAEEATRQVSQVYQRAFDGRNFRLDRQASRDLTAATRAAANAPTHGEALQRIIANEVRPLLQAGDVQAAHRLIREYRADFAGMADGRRAATALGRLQANVEGMIRRQHPDAMRDLANANRSYRRIAILERAQGQAINNTDAPGLFTPAQVGQAARDGTRQYGGRTASVSTNRPFYQSQRDAQNVLPSTIPNSGTGDRLAAMQALGVIGGGAYGAEQLGLPGYEAGAGLLGGLAALYTRPGQRMASGMFASRTQVLRDLGSRANQQYLQLPGRIQPLLPPATLPQLSGMALGMGLNSTNNRPF